MIREKEQARHEQRTTNILFNRKLPHHRKLLHMVRSSIVFSLTKQMNYYYYVQIHRNEEYPAHISVEV